MLQEAGDVLLVSLTSSGAEGERRVSQWGWASSSPPTPPPSARRPTGSLRCCRTACGRARSCIHKLCSEQWGYETTTFGEQTDVMHVEYRKKKKKAGKAGKRHPNGFKKKKKTRIMTIYILAKYECISSQANYSGLKNIYTPWTLQNYY